MSYQTFTRIICRVPNLGVVREGKLYRSALPDLDGYKFLKAELGIAVSVNLMTHSEFSTVSEAGLFSLHRPIETVSAGLIHGLTVERLDKIIDLIGKNLIMPALVHCRQGHDRTGTICAAWRIRMDGWTFDEAWAEAVSYGFNPIWRELKETIEDYAKAKGGN
jgi:tyrosine-protein phosphatase SIW14